MGMLNDTELLLNLQRANQIALSFTDSLNLEKIAYLATDGLVTHFNCAFARVWLVDKDREILRLIASSGLYTHTDGFFSNIPMGAFKIGKIAQNRASLLSNNLAEESWVRYPEWAITNNMQLFDPGAGGRHKKRRGFPAKPNHSLHRFYSDRLQHILCAYIGEVNELEQREIIAINAELPFSQKSDGSK